MFDFPPPVVFSFGRSFTKKSQGVHKNERSWVLYPDPLCPNITFFLVFTYKLANLVVVANCWIVFYTFNIRDFSAAKKFLMNPMIGYWSVMINISNVCT